LGGFGKEGEGLEIVQERNPITTTFRTAKSHGDIKERGMKKARKLRTGNGKKKERKPVSQKVASVIHQARGKQAQPKNLERSVEGGRRGPRKVTREGIAWSRGEGLKTPSQRL